MYPRRRCRRKDGKRRAYWALVESYRTARGPRHVWWRTWARWTKPAAWECTGKPSEKRWQKSLAVAQRVGRLLGRNTRAAGLFEVQVGTAADGSAQLPWKKLEQWRDWARLPTTLESAAV